MYKKRYWTLIKVVTVIASGKEPRMGEWSEWSNFSSSVWF